MTSLFRWVVLCDAAIAKSHHIDSYVPSLWEASFIKGNTLHTEFFSLNFDSRNGHGRGALSRSSRSNGSDLCVVEPYFRSCDV